MAIHVGTSGFVYPHWRGLFYPPGLPPDRWLEFYARSFSTVEMNITFYRLPSTEAVDVWREVTPADFVFSCKGSRYLTHMKRLLDAGRGLDRFFTRVDHLRRKLRVVLWQLPPQMSRPDAARLDRFLAALPRRVRHVFEFRHPAWYTEEICEVLDRRRVAFCEHDLVRLSPPRTTGGFRYLRFHGAALPAGRPYGAARLRSVARDLLAWTRTGGEAWVYFNNDAGGAALRDARDLAAAVGLEAPIHLR